MGLRGGLTEEGWTVSHYFLLPRKGWLRQLQPAHFVVRATLRDSNGQAVSDPATNRIVVVEKTVEVRPTRLTSRLGERSWIEGIKLAAALLIAVFALVSGARDQLTKLDILPGLVAVFLVGFGADTIKNLLAPKA